MDSKRLLTGVVVGGVVLIALGYLIFDVIAGGFYDANMTADVAKDPMVLWAGIVGSFLYATLVTLAIGWSGATGAAGGFRIGAIVGFLLWGTVDFSFFSFMDITTLTLAIVDPFVEAIHGGIGGAVIGGVLAKISSA